MTLSKIFDPTQNSRVGLWSLTEHYGDLFQRVVDFGFDVSAQIDYKSELKREQWLAARCLLKEMDSTINEIYYDEMGAPNLDNGIHVSLSHSHHMIAAIIDKHNKVGIDIQHLSPKIEKIKKKFCSQEELAWTVGSSELEKLHIIWSAKESIYKWARKSGLIFKKEISLQPFELDDFGDLNASVFLDGKWHGIQLKYEIIEDYTLVYTVNL